MDWGGIIVTILIFILFCAAISRVIYKKVKGEEIHIEPVGVMKDLPSDVTGMDEDKRK